MAGHELPGQGPADGLVDHQDPPLLPIQAEFKALADKMLEAGKIGSFISRGERQFIGFGMNHQDFIDRIRATSLADAFPKEDEEIEVSPDGVNPVIKPFDRSNLLFVAVRVLNYEMPKHRRDPKGPSEPPYEVLEFPGETDWSSRIQLVFSYGTYRRAKENISLSAVTNSIESSMPNFSREINLDIFNDGVYPFAKDVHRAFKDEEEARIFMGFADEIFSAWQGELKVANQKRMERAQASE